MKKFYTYFIAILLIPISINIWASEISAPHVLASIKPLQLISEAITHGVSNTAVLLPPGASPHTYSMKFSDRKKIDNADVILWVGPDLENFLSSVLKNTKNKNKAISMMDLPGLYRMQGDEEADDHNHGDYNPHIWLDPNNAIVMATAISNYLQKIDTNENHRRKYASNLKAFISSLKAADQKNIQLVKNIKSKPFFVFHDAYGYLQKHYDLNLAGYVTLTPEQQPGAKHLAQIRERLKQAGPSAIFIEPEFQPAYIKMLIADLPVKEGVLDPLATNIAVTPNGYIQFIDSLVRNIHGALSTNPKS